MTDKEWQRETSRLKGAITRAKTAMQKAPSLADKLLRRADVRDAEEALRQHKLNYFELTRANASQAEKA